MPEKEKIEDWQKVHSAIYILEDLNHPEGRQKIADLTGMPLGVINEAFKNIFDGYVTH